LNKRIEGVGRFNYTSILPTGLKVKVRKGYENADVKQYMLEDLSIFKDPSLQLHDDTYYGLNLTEEG